MAERTINKDELSEVSNERVEAGDMRASNESQEQRDIEVPEESPLTGDEGISKVTAKIQSISLSPKATCRFCRNTISYGKDNIQHWTGDSFKLNTEQLNNPLYNDNRYHLPPEYLIGPDSKKRVNLSKIVDELPDIIQFIQEPSSPYNELEKILNQVKEMKKCVKKIKEIKITETDKMGCSLGELDTVLNDIRNIDQSTKKSTVENVAAPYSKETQVYPTKGIESSGIHFIDCEYTLKISIPPESVYSAFCRGKLFEPKETDQYRWIFIPSSDRFEKDIKLDYSNEKSLKRQTLSFVVVRGNQFESYRKRFGATLPIIQLPEIVIGVGYARFWIVKIAKRFKLEYMWMIDDSVSFFKENIPTMMDDKFNMDTDSSKQQINTRCSHYCFQKMENILKNQSNLVAISPRCYRHTGTDVAVEFTYKIIQSVILLNITKLSEKNLNFRPELRYMEDVIFSKECTNAGFKVCVWNAILFKDTYFPTTGANTLSQSPKGELQTQNRGLSETKRELFKGDGL